MCILEFPLLLVKCAWKNNNYQIKILAPTNKPTLVLTIKLTVNVTRLIGLIPYTNCGDRREKKKTKPSLPRVYQRMERYTQLVVL